MTKRELIEALERFPVRDDAEVFIATALQDWSPAKFISADMDGRLILNPFQFPRARSA